MADEKYKSHIDKIPVYTTAKGASYIKPFDLIRSKRGREVIDAHARLGESMTTPNNEAREAAFKIECAKRWSENPDSQTVDVCSRRDFEAGFDAGASPSPWVRITKDGQWRRPEHKTGVRITWVPAMGPRSVGTAYYNQYQSKWFWDSNYEVVGEVLAWMPDNPPEPYNGE